MADVELRIELPAYSHSFDISVPPSSTVLRIKEEISQRCPGQPRIAGQRLISKGRNLADEDKIDELWKAPSDSRILHLAVHPSAWRADPPEAPQSPPLQTSSFTFASPFSPSLPSNFGYNPHTFAHGALPTWGHPPSPSLNSHKPIPYIVLMHQNAIAVLTSGAPPAPVSGYDTLRQAAMNAVQKLGWLWPSTLDEPYPVDGTSGGLKYDVTSINSQLYLSLSNPDGTPTPVQQHALKVLSYTFTLLEIDVVSSSIARTTTTSHTFNAPHDPNLNRLLQQLNLPQLGVAPNGNNGAGPQVREIPIRPLLMPLVMLIFRMVLLLYFVAPVRKPIFGVFFLAWMLYELWQPIRNGLIRRGQQQPGNNDIPRPPNPEANNVPANGNAQAPFPQPPLNPQAPININRVQQWDFRIGTIFDNLGDLNLQREQRILDQADRIQFPEPTIGHNVVSFLGLFLATLHPALWNRRRNALRRREGPIRTEANIRQQPDPEPRELTPEEPEESSRLGQQIDNRATEFRDELRAKHARRPVWVQAYIERVVAEEWVDDLD